MNKYRTLILNADYTPLKIIGWKKAFMICFKHAAYPIHYHDRVILDSRGREHPVPSVIVLKSYHQFNGGLARCTLQNVMIRDMYTCQYCGKVFDRASLSVDHVIPRSYWHLHKSGTPTTFNNVVAACKPCNKYKGDKLLGQAQYPHRLREDYLKDRVGTKHVLSREPKAITYAELLRRQIQAMYKPCPREWEQYVKGTK